MGKRREPVLIQRIFEARYDQGYRYLDRCGDVMVILEELLKGDTKHVWLPQEMSPTGAKLKCPDLDVTIVFNSQRLVVDQNPVGDIEYDFANVAQATLATITGRFDLRTFRRYGSRRVKLVPADSVQGARELSVKRGFIEDWRGKANDELKLNEFQSSSVFEAADHSVGISIRTGPFARIGTDIEIDERLRHPAHLLPEGQHDVLMEQLKRRRKMERDPEAGLRIDIDYYRIEPPSDETVAGFLAEAAKEADRLEENFLSRGGH